MLKSIEMTIFCPTMTNHVRSKSVEKELRFWSCIFRKGGIGEATISAGDTSPKLACKNSVRSAVFTSMASAK
jgi:hypothetical protein